MVPISRPVASYGDFFVLEIGEDRAEEMTAFVFEVYFNLFSKKYGWDGEFDRMRAGDRDTLTSSTIYAAIALNLILATIRVIEKGCGRALPLEKDFGIDVFEICKSAGIHANRIFEIGRLAKSPFHIRQAGMRISREMEVVDSILAQTVIQCSQERGNVWFASIDTHALTVLRRRGFPFMAIGEAVDYLGSPTVPVMLAVDHCRDVMQRSSMDRYHRYFTACIPSAA